MALAYRATATTGLVHGGTTLTVNKPSAGGTVAAGDLLLIFGHGFGTAQITTPPSGFSLLVNGANNFGVIYAKIATGSEPASYSFTFTGSGNGSAICVAITGQHAGTATSGWFDPASFPAIFDPGTASASDAVPSITLTGSTDWLLGFYGAVWATSQAITQPAGFTLRASIASGSTVGADVLGTFADVQSIASGATGIKTATLVSAIRWGLLVGILPAAASTTPPAPAPLKTRRAQPRRPLTGFLRSGTKPRVTQPAIVRAVKRVTASRPRSSLSRPAFVPVVTVTAPIVPAPVRTRRTIPGLRRSRITPGIVVTVTAPPTPVVPAPVRTKHAFPGQRRSGQFRPVVSVTVQPPPAPVRTRRVIPRLQRSRISTGIVPVVTVTVVLPAPAPLKTRRTPRAASRSRITPGIVVTVAPVAPAPVRTKLRPFQGRKRGTFRAGIVVTVAPAPIVPPPVRSKRRNPFRAVRSAFRRGLPPVFVPVIRNPICLGGTAVTAAGIAGTATPGSINGTAVRGSINGTAVRVVINGTALAVDPGRNGTALIVPINGTKAIAAIAGSKAIAAIAGSRAIATINGSALAGNINGTASHGSINGTAIVVDPGRFGTATPVVINGTLTEQIINGTETGWCMIAVPLTLGEFNDVTVNLAFTASGGGALNITGATIDVFLKTAAGVADTDPSTIKLSSAGGSPAVTIISGVGGTANVAIPAADVISLGITFWRADVVLSSLRNTAMYGPVTVTPL